MDTQQLYDLVESSDLDGLVRFVDRMVDQQNWAGLLAMRDRCREATNRGKQLWGAADFAEYRLALDAPSSFALDVIRPGAGRFSNGPLWEVAASTHAWEELVDVEDSTMRALMAHERLLRGDDLMDIEIDPFVVDAPAYLEAWEPVYPVAVYRPDGVDFPEGELSELEWIDLGNPGERLDGDTAVDAMLDLVLPWLDDSNGRGEAVAVKGTAESAIRVLGPRRVRSAEVSLAEAMATMAWAGASGGAHGRRRGAPVGRALAWWVVTCLVGLEEDWPIDGVELGVEGQALRWIRWEPGEQIGGWSLHLAMEDPIAGTSWAISAVDAR